MFKSNLLRPYLVAVLLCMAGPCLAGCGSAVLEPAADAERVPGHPKAARARQEGVEFTADARAWNGPQGAEHEITPFRVTITNTSGQAVTADYKKFSLVSSDGQVFAPLTPEEVPLRRPQRSLGLPPDTYVARSGGAQTGNYQDPTGNRYSSPEMQRQQALDWLSTNALPSRVIAPGESAAGWVYFERVPADKEWIQLRSSVQAEGSGREIPLAIKFNVKKK